MINLLFCRYSRRHGTKPNPMPLLEIEDLTVEFATGHGSFRAVDGVSLSVEAGDVLAVVGESGSGKSVAMLAVMGLLPKTAHRSLPAASPSTAWISSASRRASGGGSSARTWR